MRNTILIFILSFLAVVASAQEADSETGCAPLEVVFTAADSLQNYFWDFGDATNSELQNPKHIYTLPGSYTVRLFDQQGGTEIGNIIITVLPMVETDFIADVQFGCAPLTVSFTNNSIIPQELLSQVTYEWVFGDGATSTEINPSHHYVSGGDFSVSLKVITPFESCDDTEIKSLYIKVPPVLNTPLFTPDNRSVCNPTDPIEFSVDDDKISGVTYTWDFGDGNMQADYGPVSHVYGETGSYFASLTVNDAFGCSTSYEDSIAIVVLGGPPTITRLFDDTICAGTRTELTIESNAGSHRWSIASSVDIENRFVQSPTIEVFESGNYNIFLKAGPSGCSVDTIFAFTAVQPNAGFYVTPEYFCADPTLMTFTADDKHLTEYIWDVDPSQSDPIIQADIAAIDYDSFFIHRPTKQIYTLTVVDDRGCGATGMAENIIYRPDAYFIPSVSSGCAPLTIDFSNVSTSRSEIITNSWIFGDGQRLDENDNRDQVHIYEDPGEYYVRLIIENQEGCRDTSHAIKISVGEEIDLNFEIDENDICIGDSVSFSAITMDDRIDAWHFYSDAERTSHCYTTPDLSHIFFSESGLFDVTLDVDYNGCISSLTKPQSINVNGPLAKIDYQINCESPYEVVLSDLSEQAENATWKIGDEEIPSMGGDFIYTFNERGDYIIYLEAQNENTGCPNSIDSITVFIRDVQSNFSIQDKYCAGDSITLMADVSLGVDTSCYKGYTWYLPSQRSLTTWVDSVDYIVNGRGEEQFILITEDLNGCTDTLIKTASVFNIDADYLFSDDTICLQQAIDFTDKSESDTTIIDWYWSFGSSDQHPSQIVHPFPDTIGSTTKVTLMITDAAGCSASITKRLIVYHPFTEVEIVEDTLLCLGEEVSFTASDFTEDGSFFNYLWNAESGTSSTNAEFITSFNETGNFYIKLMATENSSGCEVEYVTHVSVESYPESDFTFPQEIKCKDQILFSNLTTSDFNVMTTWIPGDGSSPITDSTDLKFGYDVGTYEISLISTTLNGCADTITKTLEIVAPEGDFFMSDSIICIGDRIDLALKDTANVVEFVWDFGDGRTSKNINPIAHEYDTAGTPRSTQVTLTLRTENGCEASVVKPLRIDGVLANFGFELDSAICAAQFIDSAQSTSQQELLYTWIFFENGPTSNEMNPSYVYGAPGTYTVYQIIQTQEGNSVCRDTFDRDFNFPPIINSIGIPNAFTPNNDNRNDFFNVVLLEDNLSFESIQVNEFKIFNRWGKLVYDNYDAGRGWNGQVDGQDAPAEVYAYIVELTLKDGSSWSKKGNVTLLRGR